MVQIERTERELKAAISKYGEVVMPEKHEDKFWRELNEKKKGLANV